MGAFYGAGAQCLELTLDWFKKHVFIHTYWGGGKGNKM